MTCRRDPDEDQSSIFLKCCLAHSRSVSTIHASLNKLDMLLEHLDSISLSPARGCPYHTMRHVSLAHSPLPLFHAGSFLLSAGSFLSLIHFG